MVYHDFWLVSMVLLVENTTKLYPGPTIQSRPCRPKAGFGLVLNDDDDDDDDDDGNDEGAGSCSVIH